MFKDYDLMERKLVILLDMLDKGEAKVITDSFTFLALLNDLRNLTNYKEHYNVRQ